MSPLLDDAIDAAGLPDYGLSVSAEQQGAVLQPYPREGNAAHLCDGHREVDNLVFPTKRRVVPKGPRGRRVRNPTVVSIELDSIGVD